MKVDNETIANINRLMQAVRDGNRTKGVRALQALTGHPARICKAMFEHNACWPTPPSWKVANEVLNSRAGLPPAKSSLMKRVAKKLGIKVVNLATVKHHLPTDFIGLPFKGRR